MSLLNRNRDETVDEQPDEGRPLPDEAPEPQPEHEEPRLDDPGLTDLSKRDHVAIVKRAIKKRAQDHKPRAQARRKQRLRSLQRQFRTRCGR